jgi:hypothetical protein
MRALLLIALFAVPAVAQTTAEKKPEKRLPVQHLDITNDDLIEGTLQGPSGSYVVAPPERGPFPSLIKVRVNFNDKMLESVHSL